jgi:hypothetical protein
MTISAAPVFRNYDKIPPLNRHQNDHTTSEGVRICLPVYIDPPVSLRKELLNAVRTKCFEAIPSVTQPDSLSGLQVVSNNTHQPLIERYLGMTVDNLRNILFQRGGLEASLILKLESVTGIEVVSSKDWTAAFKKKQNLVKDFPGEYPFSTLD